MINSVILYVKVTKFVHTIMATESFSTIETNQQAYTALQQDYNYWCIHDHCTTIIYTLTIIPQTVHVIVDRC